MGCPHPLSLHMLLVDGASEGQARTTYPSFDTVVKQVFNLTKDVRICAYAFKNKLWVTALMKELAEQINTLIDILSQGAQPSTKKAKSISKGTNNNSRSLLVENVQKHLEEGLDVMVEFNLAEVNRDERKKAETAPIEPELVVKFVCAVDAIYYWLYNYAATAHGPQKYVSLSLSLFCVNPNICGDSLIVNWYGTPNGISWRWPNRLRISCELHEKNFWNRRWMQS